MLSTRLIRSIADGPQTRAIHAVLEGAELGGEQKWTLESESMESI